MTGTWLKTTLPIALIFAFRMLGLFMLIPIFSIYGQNLEGSTPILIGIALGAYGFTQGLMQMPFGILSDYYGRKKLLYIGLLLFALGSLIEIYATSIYGMILARTIQGFGAIGSVLIAMLADLIEDQDRPKAMAVIGMCIGLSFAIAMIISPSIAQHYGLSGIFQFTLLLIICGFIIAISLIPKIEHTKPSTFSKQLILESLLPPQLLSCHLGIFGQHFILTSSFFAIPIILKSANVHLTHFYLSLMVSAFILMFPLIRWAERHQCRNKLFQVCLYLLIISQLLMIVIPHHVKILWLSFFIYFFGFNILEALFPSMIAKAANPKLKGTATGIYSTSQFLGIFAGGFCAGILFKYLGTKGIFLMNAILAILYTLYHQRIQKKD
jgi:MFS family permease